MAIKKRFLVIVRAGDRSLHPGWTSSLDTRDWDLVVSYFGDDPHRYRDSGGVRIDDKGPKWPGLNTLLSRDDLWRDYDYIWLPDDDLAATQAAVSTLFAVTAFRDLALSQPALSWLSFYSHPVTIRRPSFRLRLTDFVENMAPCFRRDTLETCLPTMGQNLSGWGLGSVWPRLLGDGSSRIAIIDDVTVTHTRPVGGPNYTMLRAAGISPQAEMDALLSTYGIRYDDPKVLAAVDRDGRLLSRADPDDASRLKQRLRNDWRDFLHSRQRLDVPAVTLPTQSQRAKWGW
ncbi:MAG TPA: DUF707 domain-containing protein [Casimicrobiaceae bacterium]|nr:DUF707 domain-containing protein [Casimicrobiaceae bacterium]